MTEIEKQIRKDAEKCDILKTVRRLYAKYKKEFAEESPDRAVNAVSAITGLSANTIRKYVEL